MSDVSGAPSCDGAGRREVVSDDGGNKFSEVPSPKATRLLDINSYFE